MTAAARAGVEASRVGTEGWAPLGAEQKDWDEDRKKASSGGDGAAVGEPSVKDEWPVGSFDRCPCAKPRQPRDVQTDMRNPRIR